MGNEQTPDWGVLFFFLYFGPPTCLKLPLNTAKYRDFNNVPKLRREQLKRNYKPNPRYIKRIAAKASIPLEIQKTNDDMIVEARLKYIEENEVSQLDF